MKFRSIHFFLLFFVLFSTTGFSFLKKKDDWKENIKTVGIRVHINVPELKVYYARGKFFGLNRLNQKALNKDKNINNRIDLALKDFSFQDRIYQEFDSAIKRLTTWKLIPEEEWKEKKPDLIFDIEIQDYGFTCTGIKYDTKVLFNWQVKGVKTSSDKVVWQIKKKKVSSGRHLKKWMDKEADMLKGELRAHIMYAVQDLFYKTKIRK